MANRRGKDTRTGRPVTRRWIALFRGINVGRAKRIAMADLRALFETLGFSGVRTLLNSGNVVFEASGSAREPMTARIEKALVERLGVSARVTLVAAAELAAIVEANPLTGTGDNPSRLLVAFLANPADRGTLTPLLARDWSPEALAIGERAAYVWCPDGIIASRLITTIDHALRDAVTMRNWATVMKLQTLVAGT